MQQNLHEFRTYFYAKSPLMKFSAVVYAIVFVVMVVFFFMNMEVIVAQGKMALAYGFFVLCTLFMLARSLYFIYETIVVDVERQEIRYRLLRKTIAFKNIIQVRKVRAGQLRILATKGVHPVSVEDEEAFLRLLETSLPTLQVS
ncbi:MAG: hypothetical protein J6R11_07660 [Bacteroidaceae bacterium]|nr:hypothetical protein [Bacteroidaceae bacterium]